MRPPLSIAPFLRVRGIFFGDGLRSRALRGTAASIAASLSQQGLRLISNLILTRLLFPEAFGLMALIQSFMVAMVMFSDLGTQTSIIQSDRGENEKFLNTAFTFQAIRGVVLWLACCALAWPLASFYDETQILYMLPVVGLTAIVDGLGTTKVAVAGRNLHYGRQTGILVACQAITLVVMIVTAWLWPSVWALVVGNLFGSVLQCVAMHLLLPGRTNRFQWDASAFREIFGFGKFIFISSVAGFFVSQGDKLLLGKTMTMADLGIYNIAFYLAAFPSGLGAVVANKILFPLYRHVRPSESAENRLKIRRARTLLISAMLFMLGSVAILGDWMVDFLYDDRYVAAGPMLILLAVMNMPTAIMMGVNPILLAEGDSRSFAVLTISRGLVYFASILVGFWAFGLFGILMAQALMIILTYPLQQYFLARHNAGDIRQDLFFFALGGLLSAVAIAINFAGVSGFVTQSLAHAPLFTGTWAPQTIFAR